MADDEYIASDEELFSEGFPVEVFKRLKVLADHFSAPGTAAYEDVKALSDLLLTPYRNQVIDYILDSVTRFFAETEPDENLNSSITAMKPPLFDNIHSVVRFLTSFCVEFSWEIIGQFVHEALAKRLRMVLIFKAIFTAFTEVENLANFVLDVQANQCGVWAAFLKRFADSNVTIRKLCVEAAVVLLRSQQSIPVVTDVQRALKRRLLDLNESVREETVRAIEAISEERVENLCSPVLMRAFASRCGDIEPNVRVQAVRSVAVVFSAMVKINDPQIVRLNHVFKLASAVVLLYKSSKSEAEKTDMECSFERNLVEAVDVDAAQKARNLLNLICYCVDKSLQAIAQILYNQNYMRRELMRVIESVERSSIDADEETRANREKNLKKQIRGLSKYFPQLLRSEVALQSVLVTKLKGNSSMISKLKSLLSSDRSIKYEEALRIAGQFSGGYNSSQGSSPESDLTGDADEGEFLIRELIVQRCSPFIIDLDILEEVLRQIKRFDPLYGLRLASFVALLTNICGSFFRKEHIIDRILELPTHVVTLLASHRICSLLNLSEDVIRRIKVESESRPRTPSSASGIDEAETTDEEPTDGQDVEMSESHPDEPEAPVALDTSQTPHFVSRHILEGYMRFLSQ